MFKTIKINEKLITKTFSSRKNTACVGQVSTADD